jgi:hypothetical protein
MAERKREDDLGARVLRLERKVVAEQARCDKLRQVTAGMVLSIVGLIVSTFLPWLVDGSRDYQSLSVPLDGGGVTVWSDGWGYASRGMEGGGDASFLLVVAVLAPVLLAVCGFVLLVFPGTRLAVGTAIFGWCAGAGFGWCYLLFSLAGEGTERSGSGVLAAGSSAVALAIAAQAMRSALLRYPPDEELLAPTAISLLMAPGLIDRS